MSTLWIVLFVMLWVVVVGLMVLVLGLSRRLNSMEGVRAWTGEADGQVMGAIPVGSALPKEAADLLAVRSPNTAVRSSVVLFLSPGCSPCMQLADALKQHTLGQELEDDFEIVVVTDDAGAEHFGHVGRTVIDPKNTVAGALKVPGTPFGFAVDSEGIVLNVALPNTVEDVRRLAASTPVGAHAEAAS